MKILRKTKSVCPVCLKSINADLVRSGDEVILSKTCDEHGKFEAVVWRGKPDFGTWSKLKVHSENVFQESGLHDECPHNCGLCAQHGQRTCTVLFELTHACNMHCPVCFADATDAIASTNATDVTDAIASTNAADITKISNFLPLDDAIEQLKWIRKQAGPIVLQLSGGEPTVYPYLIDVVKVASQLFPAVQLNTNGLLLAHDEHLATELKKAGLSWVFLQCDGDTDAIHLQLRGQALLDTKIKAIEHCKKAGLSVVLVAVVATGVNDDKLGDILRFGLSFFPTVRGIHFQPMTLSGRNIFHAHTSHITLPEVITKLSQQSHGMVKVEHALPSSCEHALCSFHCRYYVNADGTLQYVGTPDDCACDTLSSDRNDDAPQRTIESVIRSWQGEPSTEKYIEKDIEKDAEEITECGTKKDLEKSVKPIKHVDAFDAFIAKAKSQTFSITCMAFQDVHTLDLERLQKCCVHIYDEQGGQNKLIPFCSYNLTSLEGISLYRKHN